MQSQQLQQVLEEIAAKTGGILKPEVVVGEAADPRHPLHDRFEWDDAKAGHAHRVEQARELIRSVRVEVIVQKRRISTVFYVRDPSLPTNVSGYVSLPRLKTESELVEAVIAQEFARAEAALVRARDLAAALGLRENIDEEVERIRRLAEKLPTIKAA